MKTFHFMTEGLSREIRFVLIEILKKYELETFIIGPRNIFKILMLTRLFFRRGCLVNFRISVSCLCPFSEHTSISGAAVWYVMVQMELTEENISRPLKKKKLKDDV